MRKGRFRVSEAMILLFALDEAVSSELSSTLNGLGSQMRAEICSTIADYERIREQRQPDVIFCSSNADRLAEILQSHPGSPVIAVSRLPEVHQWLDAIEAGASDYCAAPFEARHIRWILDSNVGNDLRRAEEAAHA